LTSWTQFAAFLVPAPIRRATATAPGADHSLAAVGAFCVAVSNNYLWNRYWTFGAEAGRARFEAARFFAVSLGALFINLVLLQLLVMAEMPELQAQAISVAVAMPFNFIGNKLWTFS
jgi:putative flippase GtrA